MTRARDRAGSMGRRRPLASLVGRWLRVGVVAVMVTSVGGSVVRGQDASPSPAPSAASPPLASRATELRMTARTLPDGLPRARLSGVAAGGPGFVAVGATQPEEAGPVDTLILTSPDGIAWSAADLGELAQVGTLADVVALPGWLVAVGWSDVPSRVSDAIALVSADGLTWQASVDRDLRGAYMTGVTRWRDGVLAVGCRRGGDGLCGQPMAWISDDGLDWGRVPLPADAGEPNGVASGDGIVAVLGVTSIIADGSPVVTTSTDLAAWTVQVLGFLGGLGGAIVDGDHIIAAGTAIEPEAETSRQGVVVYSPNAGRRFLELPRTAPSGSELAGIVVAGPVIAYGSRENADLQARPNAWVSLVGVDWTRIRGLPADVLGSVADLAPFPDRPGGVAVGGSGALEDVPAVWVIDAR